jgi:hypothetical protein
MSSFSNDFHIVLRLHQQSQTRPQHRVVIDDKNADLAHVYFRAGIVT